MSRASCPSRVFLLLAIALAAGGCGSSQTAVTAPSTLVRCGLTVGAPAGQVPAEGGSGTITVSASRDCTWSASTEVPWLSITDGRSGQGDGTVSFRAAGNGDPAARRGAVVLNDARVEIVQAPAACEFSLPNRAAVFGQAGGSGHMDLGASSALCSWTAVADASWITLGTREGRGSARITFDVQQSSEPSRTAEITIGGQRFTVTQSDGCAFHVEPAAIPIPAVGGSAPVRVTTTPACAWTATSSAPWIAIAAPASGTGTGAITISVAATSGAARTGTAVVAGQPIVVSQAAAGPSAPDPSPPPPPPPVPAPPSPPPTPPSCSYAIAPAQVALSSAGGSGTVALATGGVCAWTAAASAPWITVLDTAGTGPASIRFEVAANTGSSRTGTIAAGGQTFTVNQAGACVYTIAPTEASVGALGGALTVAVSAANGCAWQATSADPWITIAQGSNGSGAGEVRLQVATNTGSNPRSGSVAIAGRTFAVTQAGAASECRAEISPASVDAPAGGGNVQLRVTIGSSCSWQSEPSVPWIRITAGSQSTGSGPVLLQIERNSGPARQGVVTVAGVAVPVTQGGQ